MSNGTPSEASTHLVRTDRHPRTFQCLAGLEPAEQARKKIIQGGIEKVNNQTQTQTTGYCTASREASRPGSLVPITFPDIKSKDLPFVFSRMAARACNEQHSRENFSQLNLEQRNGCSVSMLH